METKYSSISVITTKKAQTNVILTASVEKYNITAYPEMLSLLSVNAIVSFK